MQNNDTWTWKVCNLPLKTSTNKAATPLSLKPMITLLHPQPNGPDPNIRLSVESAKSFQYSDETGWTWHKSWKLPIIKVNLDLFDPTTEEKLVCPSDIYAQIYAVKATLNEDQKPVLTDVGLKGNTKIELTDSSCSFESLKFQSTSYNSDGVKFHLVVCVYLLVSEDIAPKMLKAIISPGIFVDSRKTTKDTLPLGDTKLRVYLEPFAPDSFTRCFVKRNNRKKDTTEEDIGDSIEGLTSYLTAPNIRNKVKHPIFLSVRFPSCVSLYYNTATVPAEVKPKITKVLQDLLERDYDRSSFGSPNDIRPENSYFIMCIDIRTISDKLIRKKVSEALNPIRYEALSVVFSKTEVPQQFTALTDLPSLMEQYSTAYTTFVQRTKANQETDSNEADEDGPTENLAPPAKQVLDLRQNKTLKNKDWLNYFKINPLSINAFQENIIPNEAQFSQPVKKLKTENHVSPGSSTQASKNSSLVPKQMVYIERKSSPSSQGSDSSNGLSGSNKQELLNNLIQQGNFMLRKKLSEQDAHGIKPNSQQNMISVGLLTQGMAANNNASNQILLLNNGINGMVTENNLSPQLVLNNVVNSDLANKLMLINSQNPVLLQQQNGLGMNYTINGLNGVLGVNNNNSNGNNIFGMDYGQFQRLMAGLPGMK